MGLIFADTSTLLKRHIAEPGSAWVRSWVAPDQGNLIVAAELAIPEAISALARRQRQRQLSMNALARLRADFVFAAEEEYLFIAVSREILMMASDLVLRHPLRTLDAIHLAAAHEAARRFAATPLFVTADQLLLAAAAAEGFPTDDPSNH